MKKLFVVLFIILASMLYATPEISNNLTNYVLSNFGITNKVYIDKETPPYIYVEDTISKNINDAYYNVNYFIAIYGSLPDSKNYYLVYSLPWLESELIFTKADLLAIATTNVKSIKNDIVSQKMKPIEEHFKIKQQSLLDSTQKWAKKEYSSTSLFNR